MRLFTVLLNLAKRIVKSFTHADENLQEAKDYTNSIASDLVKIGLFTSGNVTLSAGSATQVNVNFTAPAGYKFIDVLNARTNGNVLSVYASGLSSSNIASAWVRNTTSSSSTVTVTIFILFIKNVGGVILNHFFGRVVVA